MDPNEPADKTVVRTTVAKTPAGDYQIRAYNDAGERIPSADAFEGTLAHARETAAAMVRGVPACTCRPAKAHRDCAYCGTGYRDGRSVCGVCKATGVDGPTIPGTGPRRTPGCPRHGG